MDQGTYPKVEEYPIAEQVTYKMFVGRIKMFEGDFGKAEDYLQFAFNFCHKNYKKNKRSGGHWLRLSEDEREREREQEGGIFLLLNKLNDQQDHLTVPCQR